MVHGHLVVAFDVGHFESAGIAFDLLRAKGAVQDRSGREEKASVEEKPDPPNVGKVV